MRSSASTSPAGASTGRWRAGSLAALALWLPVLTAVVVQGAWLGIDHWRTLQHRAAIDARAMAQLVAARANLSLFAADMPELRRIAQEATQEPHLRRVEIRGQSGSFVSAGEEISTRDAPTMSEAPVLLRPSAAGADDAPPTAAPAPIGSVRVWVQPPPAWSIMATPAATGAVALAVALALSLALWRQRQQRMRELASAIQALHSDSAARLPWLTEAAGDAPASTDPAQLTAWVRAIADQRQRERAQQAHTCQQLTDALAQSTRKATQASEARARFMAAASHDLRQPLHAVGYFLESLLTSVQASQRPPLLQIQRSVQVMTRLLDKLLELSRLDARAMAVDIQLVELRQLFAQVREACSTAAGRGRVRCVFRSGGLMVRTDVALLRRMLTELLDNALRHVPAGGTVLVAARRADGGAVRIEVRDNGIGIAAHDQQRVFDEFFQVANVERDPRQGLGLGLPICARMAAVLGATLSLRSSPGRGSVFAVTLPASQPLHRDAER